MSHHLPVQLGIRAPDLRILHCLCHRSITREGTAKLIRIQRQFVHGSILNEPAIHSNEPLAATEENRGLLPLRSHDIKKNIKIFCVTAATMTIRHCSHRLTPGFWSVKLCGLFLYKHG
jgi:hypothetical protein